MLENDTKIPFPPCQSNKTNFDKTVCLVQKYLNGKVIIPDNELYDRDFHFPRES